MAARRIQRILTRHGIATARTLEQKISDAGPFGQRMEPHILTLARNGLRDAGALLERSGHGERWYYLSESDPDFVEERYDIQGTVYRGVTDGKITPRLGQTLEIAVYRALNDQPHVYLGRFKGLDTSKETRKKVYKKEEPPNYLGNLRIGGNRQLDFLFQHAESGWAGIEVKNVREWLYPDRAEIRDLISKAVALDCVPVLIARRFPYVTFKVLNMCGVVVHQTYNQRFHVVDHAPAAQAKDKNLLGYHDIRVGDAPDDRLVKFITVNLPAVLPAARERFEEFKDLLEAFGDESMGYQEFAGRARRRNAGEDEDADWDYSDEIDEAEEW